jgi:IS5 family transposase
MRETRNAQLSIFDCYAKHEMGSELAMMSALLDRCPAIVNLVETDLVDCEAQRTGRAGLPVESVLRCAVLKQSRQLSYHELAFYLEDSASFRSFARLPQGIVPKKSALQANIRRIQPETWERINQLLVEEALSSDLESREQVRIDSTVVATNVHDPSDSSLLCDGVRILTRQMAKAKQSLKVPGIRFTDHRKAARRLARQVFYTRGVARKKPLYEGLLGYAEQVLKESHAALVLVERMREEGPEYAQCAWQVSHTRQLLKQVIE